MKKLLFIIAIAVGAVSCFSPYGELSSIANVPGVEAGKGNNNYNGTTKYKGALLPDPDYGGREDMVYLLELVDNQNGDIDDETFVTQLTEKVFECTDRFIYIHDPEESDDYWSYAGEWVGGQMYYSLSLIEDGTFVIRYYPGCAFHDCGLEELGYKGWHSTGVWEYDKETNTLYTSEDKSYAAKVLYFDGEFAVLEGHVCPMWMYNSDSHNYRRSSPMELYGFKFSDGKAEYLDGFKLTYKEYIALEEQLNAEQ